MSHVSPERWADAAAGKLSPEHQAKALAHAAECPRCSTARARVLSARAAMAELRGQPAPELAWDSIRAKIRWELSPAGRTGEQLALTTEDRKPAPKRPVRRSAPVWAWWAGATVSAALAVPALFFGTDLFQSASSGNRTAELQQAGAPLSLTVPAPEAPVTPIRPARPIAISPEVARAAPLVGLVTRTRGAVQIDGESAQLFDRQIRAGAVLASGAGWMDVQLGDGSALALGPRSSLRVDRLDGAAIEVSIDGVVDLLVAPRAPGQRFVVHAGAQTVEVHGTQFRVDHRADQTSVACRHGLVTVREGARSLDVSAGHAVAVHTGQAMPAPSPLSEEQQIELALAVPYQVPWADAEAVARSTSRLELVAPAERRLRLDGIELGAGSTEVRVVPGRHLVEAAADGGAFQRAGWAVISAIPAGTGTGTGGATKSVAARFEVGGEETIRPPSSSYQRLQELRARLSRARLSRCVRSLAKQGVASTFVRVELGVERDGTIGYLNILDTDLPVGLAECVRATVADVRFVAGPAAKVVERIDL